ncbi:hypothetical protein [Bdellovibrio sp. HCB2-146]|uniref:hypothetical protein n=1 Tax=Bdellovibrio sp. HCB2-146 TaxID=3394362 RepID=UPI0039BD8F88
MNGNLLFAFLTVLLTVTSARADFIIEAENAQQIVSPFTVMTSSSASNGKVVVKSKGSRGRGKAVFSLSVQAASSYTLRAQVYAPSNKSNSFLVQVNNGSLVAWQLPVKNVLQIVQFQNVISLNAGVQSLTIYGDESGAMLDRVELIQIGQTPTPTPTPSPSPTPSPTPSNPDPVPPTSGQNANLGVNLEGLNDWAASNMFTDLMKTSRHWGTVTAPWEGQASVDSNGWPTQDAGVLVAAGLGPSTEDPTAAYLKSGIYKLSFVGKATVSPFSSDPVTVTNYIYNSATNTSTADVVVPDKISMLMLNFTGTVGGVKNVVLMRPGYQGTGKVFTDEFLAAIAPFSTLRFMEYLSVNDSTHKTWSQRTTPNSATYAGSNGGPYEGAIALANLTGKDIWLNIPLGADDNYVAQLATLLKNTLSPNIHVYIEYSNEIWNSMFQQTHDNFDMAVAEVIAGDTSLTLGTQCTAAMFASSTGNCNQYWAGYRRVAKRTVQISNIFAQVYGSAAINTTIRPVLATQFAYKAIGEQQLKYMNTYHGAPSRFIYAIAGAPYYQLENSISNSINLTLEQIFASFDKSLLELNPYFRADIPYNGSDWSGATQLALAKYYGIKSFAYEGGPDYLQNSASLVAKYQSNFDPRSYTQVSGLLQQWFGCKNDLFMFFNLAGTYGQYGAWGATDNINNLNTPKMKALRDIANTPVENFNTCK